MKYTGNLPFGTRQTGQYTLGIFSSGTQVITIDSNNNVGIGTANPSYKLDVAGQAQIVNGIVTNTGTPVKMIVSGGALNDSTELRTGNGEFKIYSGRYNSTHQAFVFATGDNYTSGAERMRITSAGNVGIGTTSPTTKLHVTGITQIVESGNAAFYGGNYVRVFNDQNFNFRNVSGTTVANISLSGSSYFNGGNVGIGTTSPAHKLDVAGGVFGDYFQLDTTATPTPATGMLYWDADEETAAIKVNDISYELGQQQAWVVKNQSGAQLNKGTLVMATGTLGASGRILVERMVANGTVSSKYILGVTLENIADGADGKVLHVGKIRQINTTGASVGETWNDGDVLWAHPTTAGAFTNVEPSAPNLRLPVAFVLHAATNGSIAVRITAGNILHELHDVDASSPSNGDLLVYNSSTGVWENQTVGTAIATPTLDAVTTAGNTTTNSITVGNIDAANSITLSGIAQMSQNNNQAYIQNLSGSAIITLDSPASANGTSNIGIGTILPSSFVHIDLPLAADRFQISRAGVLKAYVDGNGQIVSYANLVSYGNSLAGGGGMFQYAGGTTTAAVGHRFKHLNNSFSASSGDQTMVEIVPSIAQTGTAGYTGLKVNVAEVTTGSGAKNLMDLQVGGASKFSVSNTGDVTVAGILTAQEFRTEYITQTVIFESGSTAFGNTADDTHSFTGSLELEGDAIVTGDVTAANFIGDGSQLTNISSGAVSVTLDDVTTNGATTTNAITVGDITTEDQINIKRAGVAAQTSLQQTGTGLVVNAPSGYHPLVVQHNGSELYRFTNTGNLGIGTSTPNNKLDVRRGTSGIVAEFQSTQGIPNEYVDIKLISGNTTSGTYGTILRHQRVGTSGADFAILTNPLLTGTPVERFRVTKDGNVGIGTTNPAKVLHIQPPAATDDGIRLTSSAGGNLISLYQENGTEAFIRMYSNNAEKIQLRANGDSYFKNGNIGIGTSSPTEALTVHSADNTRIEIKDTGENIVSHWGTNQGAAFLTTESAHPLKFYTTGAMRMIIDANGKIGINTNSPSAYLHISDTDASAYAFRTTNGGTNTFLTDIAGNVYAKGTMTVEGSMLYGDVDRPFVMTGGGGATATSGFFFAHTGNTDFSNTTGERSFMKLVPEISQTGAARYIAFDVQVSEVTTGSGPNYLARFRVGSSDKTRITNTGDIWTTGAVTGSYFVGDGSQLTNISSGAVSVDLDDVTTNGATTANAITVGGLTVDTDTLHVDATNNRVGIGTTAPSNRLSVFSDETDGAVVIGRTSNPDQRLYLRAGIGSGEARVASQYSLELKSGLSGDSAYDLTLSTASGEALRVDATNNNVGIGTTSPSFKLQVNGDFAAEDNIYLTDAGVVRGKFELNSSDRDDVDIKAVSLGSNMKFFTVDTERMRIDATGNVGIGTTNPDSRLHLLNAASPYQLAFQSDTANRWKMGTGKAGYYQDWFLLTDGSTDIFRINPGTTHITNTLAIGESTKVYQAGRQYDGQPGGTKIETFDGNVYVGAFIDYTIFDTAKNNMRSGTLQMVFDSTANVFFTDNSTLDIGDTTLATFTASVTAPNTELFFVAPDPDWHVRYHVRYL